MTAYIIRRLLLGILVLIMVTLLVFLIMHLLPGDPLILHISQSDFGSYSEQQLAALRHQYGLDKPLMVQYLDWIIGVCRGDFGTSFTYKQPVSMLLLERIPVTLNLSILAILVGSIFGISFGVICALRRGRWLDTTLTVLANLGMTLPNFWVGILLVYLLSFKFNLLPTYGYTSPFEDIGSNIQAINNAGILSFNRCHGRVNPPDQIQHAGSHPSGLHQDRLGKRLKRKGDRYSTHFKKRFDTRGNHHGYARESYRRRRGFNRNGFQYTWNGQAHERCYFWPGLSGRAERRIGNSRCGSLNEYYR